jgi:OTT_1508-like deaminase
MQQPGWGEVTCTGLAEDIALLNMLTREPGRPSKNPLPISSQSFADDNKQNPCNRELTFKYERDIVDSLSFLSATTSDPDKVMALCVEESHGREGILIRVAANTGDLEKLKVRIQKMANLLQAEATYSLMSRSPFTKGPPQPGDNSVLNAENYRSLLQEVIGISRNRIFCRLRTKHAPPHRKSGRVPGIPQLACVVASRNGDYEWEILKTRTIVLRDYFKELEDMEGDVARSPASNDCLVCILETAHEISSSHDLTTLITALPNTGKLGPDLKKSLPALIQKLGHYIVATRRLLRYARKIQSFGIIQVETIKIDPLVPRPIRDGLSVPQPANISNRYLGNPGTAKQLRKRFGELSSLQSALDTNMSQGRYKVHAEMQLLCFYSISPPAQRHLPRVICSSKNACFLCDLFVSLDGRFHMAQTHGVLYPKWALPDFSSIKFADGERERLVAVIEKFGRAIHTKVRDTLNLPEQKRLHPNESVLLIPPELTPSVLSLADKPMQEGPIVAAALPLVQGTASERSATETLVSPAMTSPLDSSMRQKSASTTRTSINGSEHGGNSYEKRGSVSHTASSASRLRSQRSGDTIRDSGPIGELDSIKSVIRIGSMMNRLKYKDNGGTEETNQTPKPKCSPYPATSISKAPDISAPAPDPKTPDVRVSGSTCTLTSSAPQGFDNPNILLPDSNSAQKSTVYTLTPPTKIIAPTLPTIINLSPSQPTTFHLTASSPAIRLRTPRLHLTLSYDRPPESVYVRVWWLDAMEAVMLKGGGIVKLERGEVQMLEAGGEFHEKEFYVWGGRGQRGDVVGVRYMRALADESAKN